MSGLDSDVHPLCPDARLRRAQASTLRRTSPTGREARSMGGMRTAAGPTISSPPLTARAALHTLSGTITAPIRPSKSSAPSWRPTPAHVSAPSAAFSPATSTAPRCRHWSMRSPPRRPPPHRLLTACGGSGHCALSQQQWPPRAEVVTAAAASRTSSTPSADSAHSLPRSRRRLCSRRSST